MKTRRRVLQKSLPGFTLIEVCIAMTIAMLILGVAVLGISGVQDEQKLRESASQIESTARDSLLKAVAEHRPVQVDIAGGIQGAEGRVEVRRYGEKSFRKPDSGEFWEFSPTGVCEPIELRVTNGSGIIEMGFDPLTGCARRKSITVNS
ncbi:MAG: Prepilin-type N-terminal cleavage/methylation protein [Verrucomicrobiaceae bacterium]|nr:Prepilin-type N-terminal cleavage/methylation protein [Verrucomicrobiaceae bacterium]